MQAISRPFDRQAGHREAIHWVIAVWRSRQFRPPTRKVILSVSDGSVVEWHSELVQIVGWGTEARGSGGWVMLYGVEICGSCLVPMSRPGRSGKGAHSVDCCGQSGLECQFASPAHSITTMTYGVCILSFLTSGLIIQRSDDLPTYRKRETQCPCLERDKLSRVCTPSPLSDDIFDDNIHRIFSSPRCR
jgi:hypothetical protein